MRLKQREQDSNYPDRRRIFASKELAFLIRWRVLRKRTEEETKLKIISFFAPNTLVASDYSYLLTELIANYLLIWHGNVRSGKVEVPAKNLNRSLIEIE